jgi:hypothetical protein
MPRKSHTTTTATRSAAPITLINRLVFITPSLRASDGKRYTPSWWHWIDLLLPSSANSAAMHRPCVWRPFVACSAGLFTEASAARARPRS